jgi:hypothetical protein
MNHVLVRRPVAALLALVFIGCAGVNMTHFQSTTGIAPKIPATLRIDEHSFLIAFAGVQSDKFTAKKSKNLLDAEKMAASSEDLVKLSVEANILESTDARDCVAVVHLLNEHKSVNYGWFAGSLMTLFTVNLLGFPVGSQHADVEISIEFINAAGQRIGEYSAKGESTSYAALYWGYSGTGGVAKTYCCPAPRASVYGALQKALNQLAADVQKDAPRIIQSIHS